MSATPSPTLEEEIDDEGPSACVMAFNANDPSGGGGTSADLSAIASVGAHALPVVTGVYARDTSEIVDHFPLDDEAVTERRQTGVDPREHALRQPVGHRRFPSWQMIAGLAGGRARQQRSHGTLAPGGRRRCG